jgi:quercetin dioxygenase-like cupin family protein
MSFLHLDDLSVTEPVPGYRLRVIHTANLTFASWTIRAGAALPAHRHPQEQVANVLEGQFELTVEGEARTVGPGAVAVIPPNAEHSGRAITDCRILDVFHPVRMFGS